MEENTKYEIYTYYKSEKYFPNSEHYDKYGNKLIILGKSKQEPKRFVVKFEKLDLLFPKYKGRPYVEIYFLSDDSQKQLVLLKRFGEFVTLQLIQDYLLILYRQL